MLKNVKFNVLTMFQCGRKSLFDNREKSKFKIFYTQNKKIGYINKRKTLKISDAIKYYV